MWLVRLSLLIGFILLSRGAIAGRGSENAARLCDRGIRDTAGYTDRAIVRKICNAPFGLSLWTASNSQPGGATSRSHCKRLQTRKTHVLPGSSAT